MNRLRRALRWLWAALLSATGARWSAKRRLRKQRAIIVLAFHRVLDDTDFRRTHSLTGMLVRRRTFEELVSYVARRFKVVDLSRIKPVRSPIGCGSRSPSTMGGSTTIRPRFLFSVRSEFR